MYFTSKRGDRIGMQIYGILCTIHFCKKYNFIYVHTPLEEKYESIFNLGKDFKKVNELKGVHINNIGMNWGLQNMKNTNDFPEFDEEFREYFTNLFDCNIETTKIINKINICIHCRRGNTYLDQGPEYRKYRFTPDSFIYEVLDEIQKKYNKENANIHIYSDNTIDEKIFNKYNLNVFCHFNEDIIESLNNMIKCDILFRYGISAFSGICALYNTNLVFSDIQDEYKKLYCFNNIKPIADFTSSNV